MNLDNIRITIPHTKGESLPLQGAFNIELEGFTLQHLFQNRISFRGKNYWIDLFKAVDRGFVVNSVQRDLEEALENELNEINTAGVIVLMEDRFDARVLIITNDTEETMLINQLKNLP
ncbi:MAG: hypothetical protein V4599_07570 [Verrucomicrobiota bacterium]